MNLEDIHSLLACLFRLGLRPRPADVVWIQACISTSRENVLDLVWFWAGGSPSRLEMTLETAFKPKSSTSFPQVPVTFSFFYKQQQQNLSSTKFWFPAEYR